MVNICHYVVFLGGFMLHSVIIGNEGYSGLNPVKFGYENCKKGHFYGPAIRTYWLIHFVVSGYGIFKIEDKEYKVGPHEIFVIPPFVETYYKADKTDPWNYTWIGFTADAELPTFLPHTLKIPEAEEIFNTMKKCEDFFEGRSAFLSARIWDLFAQILAKKIERTDYVKSALDYMHSEYMTGITIGDVADKLNIDRTYFYTIFKKKIGISPQQYLLNHRMNIAASLIKNQNISISTAAYSVGYADISVFSKAFKKHYGISPKQYAKTQ